MSKSAVQLNTNINDFYDASMFSPHLLAYYGGSDYTNFGYRTAPEQDAKTACDALMARLVGFIPSPQGKVLDVACGKGETTRYLSRHYKPEQITAINISEKQLARGRENVPGAHFMLMDATALEFPDNSFDAVVCVEAAFHFNTREKFLREALRVLKPGGHLVLSDILIAQTAEGTHQRRTSDNYVASLDDYRKLYERVGFDLEVLDDATEFSWRNHFMHLINFSHAAFLDGRVTREQMQRSLNLYYDRAGYINHYVLVGAAKP
ncbi:class I SAM-dependent methyltransferase [Solimonas terrae]|uniref:Methyltransferase domain-containing protein n=1 Tax=Solimonas terrae TaxID=1396819 RepID=A0A6M2BTH9_9GAMM|nr:class I SAM-dependent methyltransferase [Solimonas terrae]NGY05768.1 methyltransferase domain-containing protein [Solimonas terrae]